jgi:long-subunit acyl-CoA synthetase (AMP-forming)
MFASLMPTSLDPLGLLMSSLIITYEDSFLIYLPLTHVLEYIGELVMIFVGMPCGYGGRVKTPLSGTAKEI